MTVDVRRSDIGWYVGEFSGPACRWLPSDVRAQRIGDLHRLLGVKEA